MADLGLCAKIICHLCVFGSLKDSDLNQMINIIVTVVVCSIISCYKLQNSAGY